MHFAGEAIMYDQETPHEHTSAPCNRLVKAMTRTRVDGIVDADLERILARMCKDHGLHQGEAATIFAGTVAFLQMAARHPDQQFVPSEDVDKGWHTLLSYTKIYRRFCAWIGYYIDHEPNDGSSPSHGGYARTIQFMDTHGIEYDKTLWPEHGLGADCVADPCNCTSRVSVKPSILDA